MEKLHDNLWDNIRQFRKDAKPKRASFSHHISEAANHQRSISHHYLPIERDTQHNDSNKENIWAALNGKFDQPSKSPLKDYKQFTTSDTKASQSFILPITREDQLTDYSGRGLDRINSSNSPMQFWPGKAEQYPSSVKIREDLGDGISLEDTGSTQANQGDQFIFSQLIEQKRKVEEELKHLKSLVIKIRKENSQHLKQLQTEFEKEREDIHTYYGKTISEIKQKYEKELREKDEEIEALNSVMDRDNNSCLSQKDHVNNQNIIEEYNEAIIAMKKEFEEEITKLNEYYQKKMYQNLTEKEKFIQEINDLKEQVQQLQQNQQCPPTRREFGGDTSRTEIETTNRVYPSANIPPFPRNKKLEQVKDIHNLLEKINKYMDRNSIENEVSITNRRELYKEICHSHSTKPKVPEIKLWGLNEKQQKIAIRDKNIPKEDVVTDNDSDYFRSIIEECEKNKNTLDIVSEEEDTPMMNYSIKNLNNQLRFKPKSEEEN